MKEEELDHHRPGELDPVEHMRRNPSGRTRAKRACFEPENVRLTQLMEAAGFEVDRPHRRRSELAVADFLSCWGFAPALVTAARSSSVLIHEQHAWDVQRLLSDVAHLIGELAESVIRENPDDELDVGLTVAESEENVEDEEDED